MALNSRNFDPGSNGGTGGRCIAQYVTSDNMATVEGANYFNNIAHLLPSAGFIAAIMGNGNRIYDYTNTGSAVTLVNEVIPATIS